MSTVAFIVTCEHASNQIPARYRALFAGQARLFESHSAYDKGALKLARAIARALGAEVAFGQVSRLLVDLNRSLSHPALLSRFTKAAPREQQDELIEAYYRPFRDAVARKVAWHVAAGRPVVHLGVHTFAPVVGGEHRNADIGLLYDPARRTELDLALSLQHALREKGLSVRRNYPYRGAADGHTTALRRAFPEGYVGLELELNQRLVTDPARFRRVKRDIAGALEQIAR